jgi:lipoprotein-anchoring transpeptidase ErfK/SrfK
MLEGSIRVTDYYAILMRAVGSLDRNTEATRTELFSRARAMMLNQISTDKRWTRAAIEDEVENFDRAVERIESEFAFLDAKATPRREAPRDRHEPPPRREVVRERHAPPPVPPLPPERRERTGTIFARPPVLGAIAAALAGVIAVFIYATSDHSAAPKQSEPPAQVAKETPPAEKQTIDANELAPGVDGGANDGGLPYYFRRQAVYYRSVYSEGMIVIDRSQRYLYQIQPQSRAWRYGIAVGGECPLNAGFQRIREKVQWPEWTASPDQIKRGFPSRLPGGPGNPLGARALYFEGNVIGIHGTNAPRTIGEAVSLGCIRLVNDDVVDLANRVAIGAGVIVLN